MGLEAERFRLGEGAARCLVTRSDVPLEVRLVPDVGYGDVVNARRVSG